MLLWIAASSDALPSEGRMFGCRTLAVFKGAAPASLIRSDLSPVTSHLRNFNSQLSTQNFPHEHRRHN
jgi:hypothetical protein